MTSTTRCAARSIPSSTKLCAGQSRDDARRAATIALGGVEPLKEQIRIARTGAVVDAVGRDVRFAVRMLAKSPAITGAVVATLSLAIGANTDHLQLRPRVPAEAAATRTPVAPRVGLHDRRAQSRRLRRLPAELQRLPGLQRRVRRVDGRGLDGTRALRVVRASRSASRPRSSPGTTSRPLAPGRSPAAYSWPTRIGPKAPKWSPF